MFRSAVVATVLLTAAVFAADDFHDADNYSDPTEKAIMTCSDKHLKEMSTAIGQAEKPDFLSISQAKMCCENAVGALRQGYDKAAAAKDADECFTRPLFAYPEKLLPVVNTLNSCVKNALN